MDDRMGNPINRNAFVDATQEGLPSGIKNNNIHLCDSCKYSYPSCPSSKFDIVFGDSVGHDNICACNKYQPRYDEEWRKMHHEASYCQGFLEGVKMCEQAQPKQKKDWILCKDKLPKLGDLVWVTNNRRGIDVCYMDETCWRDRLDEWRYSLDGIVAWQPYEEPWPYEEKSRE